MSNNNNLKQYLLDKGVNPKLISELLSEEVPKPKENKKCFDFRGFFENQLPRILFLSFMMLLFTDIFIIPILLIIDSNKTDSQRISEAHFDKSRYRVILKTDGGYTYEQLVKGEWKKTNMSEYYLRNVIRSLEKKSEQKEGQNFLIE